jgi:cephalosporin hydroxylase
MSELLTIFDEHKTDKGSKKHFYHHVYEQHFEPIRNEKINILEIGVFKGASTAAFHEYFPNATIYGIDVFSRVPVEEIEILKEERVKWLKGDSLDPSIIKLVEETWPGVQFDLIIDDGAHWPEANRLTFKHLIQFLKEGGKYFVEDVWPFNIMDFSDYNHPWVISAADKLNPTAYNKFLAEISPYKHQLYDVRMKTDWTPSKTSREYIPDSTIMLIKK